MTIKKEWARIILLLFIVIGLVITLIVNSAGLFYVIILIAGVITGRIVYLADVIKDIEPSRVSKKAKKPLFPIITIILVLIFILNSGYSKLYALFLFFGAGGVTYYLHCKKLIGSFKNGAFLK